MVDVTVEVVEAPVVNIDLAGPDTVLSAAARAGAEAARDAAEDAADAAAESANATNAWRGKINGWPDPYFRTLALQTGTFNGKSAWYDAGTPASWSTAALVDNADYEGRAFRKTGTSNICGPRIWVADAGFNVGDVVSVSAMMRSGALGGTASLYIRCLDADGAVISGSGQVTGVADNGSTTALTMSATPQRSTATVTIPATCAQIVCYPTCASGGMDFDIVALWAVAATFANSPKLPPVNDDPFLNSVATSTRLTAAEEIVAAVTPNASKEIRGGYVPSTTFAPVLGDAETVGDNTFTDGTVQVIGFYEQATEATLFNAMQFRIWASNNTTDIEWKLYLRDTLTPFDWSAVTPDDSGTIAAGEFQTTNALYTLDLEDAILAAAGKYIIVAIRATDGTAIRCARWDYDAGVSPARHGFPFSTSGGWSATWAMAGPTIDYGQPGMKLLLRLEDVKALDTRVAANEAAIAALPSSSAVAVSLTAPGSLRGLLHRPDRMRESGVALARLLDGADIVFVEALFGDSWTAESRYWCGRYAERRIAKYGDGGPGWCDFGFTGSFINGNVRPDLYVVAKTGSWTSAYGTSTTSPSICDARSSSAGALWSVTADAAATVVPTSAKLAWEATSDGVVEYRFGGSGGWTSLNVQGTVGTAQEATLTIPGATPAAFVFEVQVVSGSVRLHGVDIRGDGPGLVFHKFASAGSKASGFAAADATQWKASIANRGLQAARFMWGTNESAADVTPATFATALTTVLTRYTEAYPSGDRCIAIPCENRGGHAYEMTEYLNAAVPVAETFGAALLDVMAAFGETVADYDGTNDRDWFQSGIDDFHMAYSDTVPAMSNAMLALPVSDSHEGDVLGLVRPTIYTVSTLPAASAELAGAWANVKFGSGADAIYIPARCNGVAWLYDAVDINLAGVAALTGTTSDTAILTINLPAGILGANGQIEIEGGSVQTENANVKTLRGKFGGTIMYAVSLANTEQCQFRFRLANQNSQSAQKVFNGSTFTTIGSNTNTPLTAAINTANATTLVISGQLANAADSLEIQNAILTIRRKD